MWRIWYPETVVLMGEQGVLEQRGLSASGFKVVLTSAAGRIDTGVLDTPLTSISIFNDMTWLKQRKKGQDKNNWICYICYLAKHAQMCPGWRTPYTVRETLIMCSTWGPTGQVQESGHTAICDTILKCWNIMSRDVTRFPVWVCESCVQIFCVYSKASDLLCL